MLNFNKLIQTLLIASLFSGCIAKSNKAEIHFNSLTGDWIITSVKAYAENGREEYLSESFIDSMTNRLNLMPVKFGEKSKLYLENGVYSNAIDSFTYQINADNSSINLKGIKNSSRLVVSSLNNEILNCEWELSGEKNLQLGLIMLKVKNDETVFRPALLDWKIRPLKNESDEEIKARLKSLLEYDYVYARNIHYSNAPVIDTRKLYLPLRYYNGGVGLLGFYKSDSFISIFFDKDDALKAYGLLQKYLPEVEYPSKNHYILEYAEFFKMIEKLM